MKQFGPSKPDVYTGDKTKFSTYNYADNRSSYFADNEPQGIKVSLQVHYFLPKNENFISVQNEIREVLWDEFKDDPDATYPIISGVIEETTNLRHLTFEFDATEEREE
jgi:hypothetical protein